MIAVPRLHAVTDAAVLARPDFLERVAQLRPLGSRLAVQVRDRSATGRALTEHAEAVAKRLAGSGVWLILNARPDLAAALHAQAVQLGAGDLHTSDVRQWFPSLAVGRSVHSVDEAKAEPEVDWLVLGTVYDTPSHPTRRGSGIDMVRQVATGSVPVIAIGGVTPARAAEVHAAGAWGVAAIRAVWDAPDSLAAAQALLAPWEAG